MNIYDPGAISNISPALALALSKEMKTETTISPENLLVDRIIVKPDGGIFLDNAEFALFSDGVSSVRIANFDVSALENSNQNKYKFLVDRTKNIKFDKAPANKLYPALVFYDIFDPNNFPILDIGIEPIGPNQADKAYIAFKKVEQSLTAVDSAIYARITLDASGAFDLTTTEANQDLNELGEEAFNGANQARKARAKLKDLIKKKPSTFNSNALGTAVNLKSKKRISLRDLVSANEDEESGDLVDIDEDDVVDDDGTQTIVNQITTFTSMTGFGQNPVRTVTETFKINDAEDYSLFTETDTTQILNNNVQVEEREDETLNIVSDKTQIVFNETYQDLNNKRIDMIEETFKIFNTAGDTTYQESDRTMIQNANVKLLEREDEIVDIVGGRTQVSFVESYQSMNNANPVNFVSENFSILFADGAAAFQEVDTTTINNNCRVVEREDEVIETESAGGTKTKISFVESYISASAAAPMNSLNQKKAVVVGSTSYELNENLNINTSNVTISASGFANFTLNNGSTNLIVTNSGLVATNLRTVSTTPAGTNQLLAIDGNNNIFKYTVFMGQEKEKEQMDSTTMKVQVTKEGMEIVDQHGYEAKLFFNRVERPYRNIFFQIIHSNVNCFLVPRLSEDNNFCVEFDFFGPFGKYLLKPNEFVTMSIQLVY